jgi:tetratricopeptide (TPR) repeat protein
MGEPGGMLDGKETATNRRIRVTEVDLPDANAPDDPATQCFERGLAYADIGNYAEAIESFRSAMGYEIDAKARHELEWNIAVVLYQQASDMPETREGTVAYIENELHIRIADVEEAFASGSIPTL